MNQDEKSVENFIVNDENTIIEETHEDPEDHEDKRKTHKKYQSKHMKMFPELYRSDVSINPSYTGLKTLPYYVVCRHRAVKRKKQISRQLNREIMHIVMMQNYALGSVRIDRIFSIGFSPRSTKVADFATTEERRRINQLLSGR